MFEVPDVADAAFLRIDFAPCDRAELFRAYEDLGVLCAARPPRGLLLRTGDEDADVHYSLRDVLQTVSRIGGRRLLHMKVALVTGAEEVAAVGEAMRDDLLRLGCRLRVFHAERHAARWLKAGTSHPSFSPSRPAA